MNRVLRVVASTVLVLAVAMAGAAVAEDTADGARRARPVVEVGDRTFTSAQLTREFGFLPPPQLDQLHRDDNAARIFAVKWYSNLLFAADAARNGLYGRRPGLKAAAQAVSRQFLSLEYQEDLKEREYAVEEKELRQLYDLDKDKICKAPAAYHLASAGVLIGRNATEAERTAAVGRMNEIVRRLEAGESFSTVAEDLSDLVGKKPGGDLGWMTDEEIGGAAGAEAITGLAAGERTDVIESPQGRAIYEMIERREPQVLSFERCRYALEAALQKRFARDIKHRRVDELAEELGASMNIDEFIAAIRAVPVPEGWQQTWGREPAP